MKKSIFLMLLVDLSLILLSACQTPQKLQSQSTEENDSDIIVMQGFGGDRQPSSLLGVKPMTFEEMASCAKNIDYLHKKSLSLKVKNAKIDNKKSDFKKKSAALDNERSSVDVKSSKKVADFNKRLEELGAAISKLDKEVDAYNEDVASMSLETNQYNLSCANRSYRQSDIAKLPSELRDAITLNSQESDIPIQEEAQSDENASNGKIHIPASSSH